MLKPYSSALWKGLRCPPISSPLLLSAVCIVGSNLGITLGIVLAGQVTASTWQPLQLVFTTLLSLLIGTETSLSWRKLVGLAFGLLGASLIVLLDAAFWTASRAGSTTSGWGHLALFVNTISSSMLFVLRRTLTKQPNGLSALAAVAWTHVLALPLLLLLGLVGNESSTLRRVVCDGCDSVLAPPTSTVWPALAFYTVVPTILCQSLMAWAAKHAEPSTMAMYPVLQPVASASLSWLLRSAAPQLREVLVAPAANTLGALPVVIGLYLVSSDSAIRQVKGEKAS